MTHLFKKETEDKHVGFFPNCALLSNRTLALLFKTRMTLFEIGTHPLGPLPIKAKTKYDFKEIGQ